MTDDEIEAWIRDLIETNMDEENQKLALDWLNARVVAYMAVADLESLHPGDLKPNYK